MLRRLWIAILLSGLAAGAAASKTRPPPSSSFRKYFWGARRAFEERNFTRARRLFQTYQRLGSPPDKLLAQAGCDTAAETRRFAAALRAARGCLKGRPRRAHWTDGDQAKVAILSALGSGDASALAPYLDCAPVDLTQQEIFCQTGAYPDAAGLPRLAAALREKPGILEQPNWREFPLRPDDARRLRWILYTYSEDWKPCGMPGAPILSLRQDPDGALRIAGFAASCLESPRSSGR